MLDCLFCTTDTGGLEFDDDDDSVETLSLLCRFCSRRCSLCSVANEESSDGIIMFQFGPVQPFCEAVHV